MAQATFTIVIKINGQTLQGTTTKFKPGGVSRELKTAAGVAGRNHVEKPEPSMCSVTILHTPDGPKLDEIRNWTNVTLVAECDNGITWQVDGAMVTNPFELSDEGGGIALEFGGPPAVEV